MRPSGKKRPVKIVPGQQGSLRIEANGELCFEWNGTRDDAIELQRLYLRGQRRGQGNQTHRAQAESTGKRAAGYLMAFGMPRVGDPDRRPSSLGADWQLMTSHVSRRHRVDGDAGESCRCQGTEG